MVSSVAYDSFAANPNTRDGRTLMAPPAGTIPRGYQPLHFDPGPAEAARAGRELHNPLPQNEAVLRRGATGFERWCSPCHGHEGQGDGLVALRFPRPPSLLAPHARGLAEGQMFHIVSFGQGVMPAYGQQVVQEDRWKIVAYLRSMQAAAPGGGAPAGATTSPATTSRATSPATSPGTMKGKP